MANLHARIFAIFVKNGILLTPNSRPLMFFRKEKALEFLRSQEMHGLCNTLDIAQHDLSIKEVEVNVNFVRQTIL